MKKHRAAIIGYGSIGSYVLHAILASPDFELAGVVRRDPNNVPKELSHYKVVASIEELKNIDVAILCVPTRNVEKYAKKCLELGISTVDSFDIHPQIVNLRRELGKVAKDNASVSVISAGWDPGTDSIVRTMMEFMAPKGITYTNFGPGMSMGHTVAVKVIEGVKSALSMTIPLGTSIHRRMVYVEIKDGYNFQDVVKSIKSDDYFKNDDTHVLQVESIDDFVDVGHGVEILRKGVSGNTHNQLLSFYMKINNPALTSQIMLASARAALKQKPGAYTMIEIPTIDYLFGDREKLIERLV